MKNVVGNKGSIVILILVLVLTGLSSMSYVVLETRAQQSPTIKAVPLQSTVGAEGQDFPTSPFTVNITVTNVIDLFAWQIHLYYDTSKLNFIRAWLPEDHVFQNKTVSRTFVFPDPVTDEDVWGLNYSSYMEVAATVIGNDRAHVFNGTGTLVQLEFTGIGSGNTTLTMKQDISAKQASGLELDTFLLNFDIERISGVELIDGKVEVLGGVTGKEDSTISIDVSPTSVTVGLIVTISGSIKPARPDVEVTIKYRNGTDQPWKTLATVQTGSESSYTYPWTTNQTGTYQVKASWAGDDTTNPDESLLKTVEVNPETEEPPQDYTTYYIVAAVVVIALIAVAVYFIRKR